MKTIISLALSAALVSAGCANLETQSSELDSGPTVSNAPEGTPPIKGSLMADTNLNKQMQHQRTENSDEHEHHHH